jgi:glucose-6-phosphate dehydrogenase assembly protein OpcA
MANSVGAPTRTFTGTLVAICNHDQLDETQSTVRALHTRSAVRPVIITLGDVAQPAIQDVDEVTIIDGLIPKYLDNVVASRRLSSLPALAWWRGGDPQVLDELAPLVDRLVLDSAEPLADWRAAAPLVGVTSITDLRWTRLTRWRNLMAQFFDVPSVRAAAGDFSRVAITAADAHAARLFAAWLSKRLPTRTPLEVQMVPADHFLTHVALTGPSHRLSLELTAAGTCVRSSADVSGHAAAGRTVSLGNQSLVALVEEEMRIRARDMAFEDALRSLAEGE